MASYTLDDLRNETKQSGSYSLPQVSAVDDYDKAAREKPFIQRQLGGLASAPIDLYLGVKQLFRELDPIEKDVLKQNRAAASAAPVASVLSNVGTYAPAMFLPGANTVAGAGIVGGISGAVQPTLEGESRLLNAGIGAIGGSAGQALGNAISRTLTGKAVPSATKASASAKSGGSSASSQLSGSVNMQASGGGSTFGQMGDDVSAGLSDAQKRALEIGQGLGLKFTPGQASGSKVLQQMEARLESHPISSGGFFEIKDNNQRLLNGFAAKAIGEDATSIDNTVLEAAKDRIGNVYKMIADKTPRPINPDDFINRLSNIESEFEGLLPANQTSILDNVLVKQAFRLAETGQATGEQLQALASKLGKAATNQMTSQGGDRQVGMALSQVKDVIDDYIESGLAPHAQKLFKSARSQYRNLMLLTSRKGVISESGDVNPRGLASVLFSKDKSGYTFGKNQNDLYSAVRSIQAFPSIVPNSGTATRSMQVAPTDWLLSLPFSLATKAYTSPAVANVAASAAGASNRGIAPALKPLQPYIPRTGGLLGIGLPLSQE